MNKKEPKPPYDPLDEIVKCPQCGQDVREGDRIWFNGQATCFDCYKINYEKVNKRPFKWEVRGIIEEKEDNTRKEEL